MHLGARVVAFERFRARRQEERIAVAPDSERWWLGAAKVFLEFGIEGHVAGIIQKEVELNLIIARPSQQSGVKCVGFGRNQRGIRDAVEILGLGRLGREEFAQGCTVLRSWLLPVFLDWIPALAQTFFISVAVLRNDGGDPLGMRQCEPKPYRSSIVEDVDRVSINTDGLCEPVDDPG